MKGAIAQATWLAVVPLLALPTALANASQRKEVRVPTAQQLQWRGFYAYGASDNGFYADLTCHGQIRPVIKDAQSMPATVTTVLKLGAKDILLEGLPTRTGFLKAEGACIYTQDAAVCGDDKTDTIINVAFGTGNMAAAYIDGGVPHRFDGRCQQNIAAEQ